jgi:CheY-like chemotaxis protein
VVAETECGDKAIEAIKKGPANLVLLDLSLPRYTGFEVVRKIREFTISSLSLSRNQTRD